MPDVVIGATLPSVRLGLIAMLTEQRHRVITEQEAGDDAVWVLDDPDPDVIDRFDGSTGITPPRAAVFLTEDVSLAGRLARASLPGWACLGRDAGAEELDLAVRAAASGLVLLDLPAVAAAIGSAAPSPSPPPAAAGDFQEPLTPRELQVLQLIAQGLPNKGIARALGISENTAKFHVAALSAKLGASSRTEAVTLGTRRGLIVL
ncbi:MAG TPA: response regulator transcription factor [Dehalococcoidia bacterium]|nr:response regulator transcription factor [Dehalococcoidia bacterium]